MGHALGLEHTFRGCATCSTCPENVDDPNCATKGDFVCDTDPDPRDLGTEVDEESSECTIEEDEQCVDNSNPPKLYEPDPDVMMSYRCESYFTDGQADRMKSTLANDNDLDDAIRNEFYIESNTTINTDKEVDVDIIVTDNVTLTINSNSLIEFAPEVGIIVDQYGTLDIENATLTCGLSDSHCNTTPEMWRGIEIKADPSDPELRRRAVEISSTSIEHAKSAIHYTPEPEPYLARKNAFTIDDVTFTNNQNSIELVHLGRYSNATLLTGPISKVWSSNFNINSSYRGSVFRTHVILIQSKSGVHFKDCTFELDYTPTSTESNAIFSVASRLVLRAAKTGPIDYNTFDDFDIPIRLKGFLNWNDAVFIATSDFDFFDNVAIRNDAQANVTLLKNKFYNKYGSNQTDFRGGVVFVNASQFAIEGNEFISSSFSQGSILPFGLSITASGEEGTFVSGNSLEEYQQGIAVYENNQDLQNSEFGLMFRCNDFTNHEGADLRVFNGASDGTIASVQGSQDLAAGNLFSIATSGRAIRNDNSQNIIDYYYGSGSREDPINSSNIDKFIVSGSSDACEDFDIPEIHSKYDNDQIAEIKEYYAVAEELVDSIEDIKNYRDDSTLVAIYGTAEIQRRYLANLAAFNYMLRDTVLYDSVSAWLSRRNTYDGALQLVAIHMQKGDYSTAEEVLAKIDTDYDLSVDQEDEFEAFEDLYGLIIDAYEDDRGEGMLDSAEVDELYNMATDTTIGRVQHIAENILEVYYGYDFGDPVAQARVTSISEVLGTKAFKETIFYPNPSSGIIFIQEDYLTEGQSFTLYSLSGQNVRSGVLKSNYIDLRSVYSGIYILKISTIDGGISEKIIIE